MPQAEEAFFGFFQQRYAVYPDTLPALHNLRVRGFKIGILTSVETSYRKLSPQGVLALAAALGVPENRMVFVVNESKDTKGANAAGMISIVLAREFDPGREDYGQEMTLSSLLE